MRWSYVEHLNIVVLIRFSFVYIIIQPIFTDKVDLYIFFVQIVIMQVGFNSFFLLVWLDCISINIKNRNIVFLLI